MEFPETGKNCAESSCKQLDFLPLQCKCGDTFCSEHFATHTQVCSVSRILKEDELQTIENIFVCSNVKCNERSVIPLMCERCKQHYCIKHRHFEQCEEKSAEILAKEVERYTEPVQRFDKAKALVDKQIQSNLINAKKKAKYHQTATKVQLMKIKNKAVGSKAIPTINRIYFNISYVDGDNMETIMPIFVSNTWSVGRAIDAIAHEMKLQNNNNKRNEKKLRLFKKEDNQIISENVTSVLNDLLNDKVIIDGEHLIIHYVEDDCIQLN